MQTLEIKAQNFIAGESSADYVSDRGFSPDSYGLNLTYRRGELYFAPSATSINGATAINNIIASADDFSYLGNDKYFLDKSGRFFTLSGTTFTLRQTSASTFSYGTSDMLQFDGNLYATSGDSLHKLDSSNLTNCERLWGGAFSTNFRHPIERVENEVFIGNGNVINYFNSAGASGTAFTLPAGQTVTSLRRHPDGRTLVAFTGDGTNYSHTLGITGKVYFCSPSNRDGIKGWDREVVLSSQVEGTKLIGGVIYCTWGNNFGYFDGNGLVFMKKLSDSYTYSHSIGNFEDIILLRDKGRISAFGDLGAGKVWWKYASYTADSLGESIVTYLGSNKIAFSDGATTKGLYSMDLSSTGIGGNFIINRYCFGSEVKIRRIDIVHDVSNPTGTTRFFILNRAIDGAPIGTETLYDANYVNQATRKTRIELDLTTDFFQINLTPSSGAIGIKLIRIYYENIK